MFFKCLISIWCHKIRTVSLIVIHLIFLLYPCVYEHLTFSYPLPDCLWFLWFYFLFFSLSKMNKNCPLNLEVPKLCYPLYNKHLPLIITFWNLNHPLIKQGLLLNMGSNDSHTPLLSIAVIEIMDTMETFTTLQTCRKEVAYHKFIQTMTCAYWCNLIRKIISTGEGHGLSSYFWNLKRSIGIVVH